MLTVSVSYPYLGGFIYSYRVLFSENGVFFLRFCHAFRSRIKGRFCARKTLVLGLVNTHPKIFENGEIHLPVCANKAVMN